MKNFFRRLFGIGSSPLLYVHPLPNVEKSALKFRVSE